MSWKSGNGERRSGVGEEFGGGKRAGGAETEADSSFYIVKRRYEAAKAGNFESFLG